MAQRYKRKGPRLISVKRIWDKAPHNALTDLIFYQGKYFCCFREGEHHAGGADGKIRILASADASEWHSVALLEKRGIDLRDPHLSEMPDGRLMLILGGTLYQKDKPISCSPHVAFSKDGESWTSVNDTKMKNEWIWQVAWYKSVGYGASYHQTDPSDPKQPWHLALFRTTDGEHFERVTPLEISNHPNETVLRFAEDGTMVALVRRRGNAWLGISRPPYTTWGWLDTLQPVGGPNFLNLPDGSMWCSTRLYKYVRGKLHFFTGLCRIVGGVLKTELFFPSGGDTSYPGMVYRDGKLYISYYSSHEGKATIYMAVVAVG